LKKTEKFIFEHQVSLVESIKIDSKKGEIKMQMEILNIKNKNSMIAIILISAMIASSIFAILPTDTAQTQTVQKFPTFIYGAVAPNPVGLTQPVTIVAWTAEMPPDIGEIAGTVTSPSTRAGWYGITVEITNPDNVVEKISLPYTDPVGNAW
jgi:hypothetical protein